MPVVIDSQLVDVADEHELNTGNRAEGVIFAVRTFAIKLTQGLGGLIAGFGLEIIGFPQDAATQGVSPEVIDGLLFMMGPLYYIIVYGGSASRSCTASTRPATRRSCRRSRRGGRAADHHPRVQGPTQCPRGQERNGP